MISNPLNKVALQRLNPQQAKNTLVQLIQQAQTIEPNLAQKLIALGKWIKDKKDGLLTSKPYVLDLLTEVINDTRLWLILNSLNEEEKQQFYSQTNFSIVEQYWFEVLFPHWFNQTDPKFPSWRREVMNGKFARDDEQILGSISRELQSQGGSFLWRHLLDLSMATDLLASGQNQISLCVQLTTLAEAYLGEKRQNWGLALTYWHIERGLLISYNPMQGSLIARLVTVILRYSDTPTAPCYTVVTDF